MSLFVLFIFAFFILIPLLFEVIVFSYSKDTKGPLGHHFKLFTFLAILFQLTVSGYFIYRLDLLGIQNNFILLPSLIIIVFAVRTFFDLTAYKYYASLAEHLHSQKPR